MKGDAVQHSYLENTPLGTLLLLSRDGRLCGLYMGKHVNEGTGKFVIGTRDDAALAHVSKQLLAYFAGELKTFDLDFFGQGTEFQQRVWAALCEIPYGETLSYGELARKLGNPKASRAVGLANGRNPISIIVPCHRVIGANGALTGYGGGIENKRWLLDHEARQRQLL